jgi:hypothetical protein
MNVDNRQMKIRKKDEVIAVQAMKAYRGHRVMPHSFLILVLVEHEWSTSCPGCFIPGKDPDIH